VEVLWQAASAARVTIGVLVDIDVGFHRTSEQPAQKLLA